MSINELPYLSGGFKYVWNFHPCVGEDEPILTIIFFKWVATTNQFFFSKTHTFRARNVPIVMLLGLHGHRGPLV